MNKTAFIQQAKTASFLPPAQGMLQRKCACGNHTFAGSECAECAKNKNSLQRNLAMGANNDPLEQEAGRVAEQWMAPALSGASLHVPRYTSPAAAAYEPFRWGFNTGTPGLVDNINIHTLKRRLSQQCSNLKGVTEDAGSAACDPDTGDVVIEVDYKKIPICMADCAFEHERAHKKFMKGECAKVSAAIKASEEANKQARKSGSEADLKKAEEALKKAEEAMNAYEKWFTDTCRENEAQAYQAGIDKCNTKKVQDECASTNDTAKYKNSMKQWETFKNEPPNCPKVEKKKDDKKDAGKKDESQAPQNPKKQQEE